MAPVRILQAIAGADFSWAPGEIVSMSDEQAAVWCDGERAELASDLVVDQAAIDAAVEAAVRQALEETEQKRQAALEGLQVQARAVVDDNMVDPDSELAAQLRELAAELVVGVAPVRAAELAIVAAIGAKTSTVGEVESTAVTAAATTNEEEGAEVSTSEQSNDTPAVPPPAEAREAKRKPERAARTSRGGGRGEPGPETRG